jgi:septal ring factor EnvC (AmiA/AmiB activator)
MTSINKKMSELTTVLCCECNGVTYGNMTKLNAHKKTMHHRLWEQEKTIKDLKGELTKRDNTIARLERKILDRDQRVMVLKERSKVLKSCLESRLDEID